MYGFDTYRAIDVNLMIGSQAEKLVNTVRSSFESGIF